MKRIIAVVFAALVLAAPAAAAPNQNCCTDPFNQFVATRILPNGNEVTLAVYSLEAGYTTDQAVRETVFAFVRAERVNNPAWVIVIYGPVDPPFTFYTDDDRIWDSRFNL